MLRNPFRHNKPYGRSGDPLPRSTREVPEHIRDLYSEWQRCSDDWDWVDSPRGRWVSYQLDFFEAHFNVWS